MQKMFLSLPVALAALSAAQAGDNGGGGLQSVVVADYVKPETVVVTATRTEQPVEKTGASLTVFTADDLKTQQTVALIDILRQTPALVVNRNGGIGQPASIGLRGSEAGQTVVLIDGVRVNDPSTTDNSAAAVLGDLLANNVERIEVLRGPQSTLYGSDAIGGVINILTKRGGNEPLVLNVMAEGGSFDTWHINAAADGTIGAVDYGAALNYFNTQGISAADSRNGNTEADGYRNFGASLNARIHLDDAASIDVRGYYTHGHDGFDDNFVFVPPGSFVPADSAANNTNELSVGYAGFNLDLFGGMLHNRLAVMASASGRAFFDSSFDSIHLNSDNKGGAVRFEYQGIIDLGSDGQVTFGAETQQSTFKGMSFSSFFGNSVANGHDRITGYYAQGQWTLFEQLTFTGGVRHDVDETFGGHTSLKLAGAWQIPGLDATLRANYGDGFKAPSLFQEFGPNSNPIAALKPETARGWEAGIDKSIWDEQLHASLTYFERHTSNQIDFQNCFTPADAPGCPSRLAAFGYYINLNRTRATGLETILGARLDDSLSASLTWTNMSATNELTGLSLARRPHNLASATLVWLPMPGTTLGGSIVYEGKRFDDVANLTRLSSNTTVNLFGSYDLTEKWQLFGRIDNVFNDRTEQIFGYGVPGIGAFGGVRTSF